MLVRILTALVVLALVLSALFWLPAPGWAGLAGVLSSWAAWEWGRLAGLSAPRAALYAAAIAVADALLFSVPGARPWFYVAAALLWIIAAPWLLKSAPKAPP